MKNTLKRRLLALEAVSPKQNAGETRPQWLAEWERDKRVYSLMSTVVAFDNRETYGDRCMKEPSKEQADAARAELRERFGDIAEGWIAEYAVIWRELQDEC